MKEEKVQQLPEAITRPFPGCAVDYSDQPAAMYRTAPGSLRRAAAVQLGTGPRQ